MAAFLIDAFEFCRLKERRSGQFEISDLPRLAAELADASGSLQWSLEGGADKLGHPRLMLSIEGPAKLVCQRCLQAYDFAIESNSTLILAVDEASADEIEERLDDETLDVIVGSRAFDIKTLVEDEALLALPLSPKHAVCPDPALVDKAQSAKKDSPFAVLKNFKKSH